MVSLIPGTHYLLPSVPNPDDTYTLTCTAAECGHEVTRVAILAAYDGMEAHWVEKHEDLLR